MANIELCNHCKGVGYCQILIKNLQVVHQLPTPGIEYNELQFVADETINQILPDIALDAYRNNCPNLRKQNEK
ncbi:MAG TPA: hypothetical protein PK370_02865 [Candidatus Woesebacteria bacterium]|nr:hypothetical protein [Candidatus Woesebacteria bacterium]HPJ16780.1 hypothetical protein [Candidatus Woesebacteria bacterium]